jgi:hypothetical protein
MKSAIIGFLGALACGPAALGVDVMVMSSSQAVDDAAVAALEAAGHTVVMGPEFESFTAEVDLSGIDVVYFQASANWTDVDMPLDGQMAIIDFVRNGGGLVTSEWVGFKAYTGSFQRLKYILPVVYKGYAGWSATTYTVVTPDATLNKGLAGSIEFPLDSFGGTESFLGAKCDATVFYDSATVEEGVVGWNYNVGRVLSLATVTGVTAAQDAQFGVLLANAMSWASLAGGKPGDGYSSDCDGSTKLDLFDFLCFANAFNAAEPYADCDGDGAYTLFDFLCFVNTFNEEC